MGQKSENLTPPPTATCDVDVGPSLGLARHRPSALAACRRSPWLNFGGIQQHSGHNCDYYRSRFHQDEKPCWTTLLLQVKWM